MYTTEKNKALEFLANNGQNPNVIAAIDEAVEASTHSDRWSIYFDMMMEHFFDMSREERSAVVVGLAYLTDEGKI